MHRTYDIRELKLNGTVSRLFRLIGVGVLLLFLFNLTTHAQSLRLPLKPIAEEYIFNEIKLPGDLPFRDVIALQLYPFRRFKIEKERTRKRAVTLQQLRALFAYPCETAAEEWAVDMARLIFYLIGINTVDLFTLEEYDGEYIHYRRAKTGSLYTVRVEPEAEALLEKYRGREHLLNFRERFRRLDSFKAKINKTLKAIAAKRPDIPPMTSYTFRHTWATLAARLDIPKETIAAGLGHAQNATVTDVYIDFDRKKVDVANRRVLDYVAGRLDD